ncbi:MAG: hypothetical protein JKY49_15530 [Cohaesibacteraceae bacterium]|nr:hypothetical protein [Cohaesibacteraceae bacterium]
MSIVVVIRKHGKTIIGCDTKCSDGNLLVPPPEKVNALKFHRIGNAYMGHVGSTAFHTVLDFVTNEYADIFDFTDRMTTYKTMLKLHKIMCDTCLINTYGEDFEGSGLNVVIATPEKIFHVEPDRGVDEFSRFWAVGSGSVAALGALDALYDRIDDIEELLREVLTIACKYDLHSNGPIETEIVNG